MEKEIGQGEFACMTLMERGWPYSLDATVSPSKDFEVALLASEAESAEESPAEEADYTWAWKKVVGGALLIGPAIDERSYLMGPSEWVEHYQAIGAGGFTYCVPECRELEVRHRDLMFPYDDAAIRIHREKAAGQILMASPVTLPRLFQSRELREFCTQHDILDYVSVAIRLINKCFPDVQELQLELERDPECGDEWLVLHFPTAGEVSEVLDRYDQYTEFWTTYVPWPQQEKIRLSYNIL